MQRCLCLKADGTQCSRNVSQKLNQNHNFCWQHQQCKKMMETDINMKKTTQKKPIVKKKIQKMHTKPISRQLKVLSGPNFFVYYKNILGKRILLLGEHHNILGICSQYYCQNRPTDCRVDEIQNWLHSLVKDSDQCLDFFNEEASIQHLQLIQRGGASLYCYNSPIVAIREEFKSCVSIPNHCHSNLRYHLINIRRIKFKSEKNGQTLEYPLLILYYNPSNKEDFESTIVESVDPIYWNKRKHLYEYLLDLTVGPNSEGEQLFNQYLESIINLFKITVEVDFYQNIRLYMLNFHKLVSKQLSKLDPRMDKNKFLITLLDVFVNSKSTLFTNLFILPQDIYLLSRLFIRFDPNKMLRGPISCQNDDHAIIKNAIVYAGVFHSQNYQEFIENYFQIQPTIEIHQHEINKCIEFDQPFDYFM
jgi:hypothetical protein